MYKWTKHLPLLGNFEFILIFIQWKIWLGNKSNGNFW